MILAQRQNCFGPRYDPHTEWCYEPQAGAASLQAAVLSSRRGNGASFAPGRHRCEPQHDPRAGDSIVQAWRQPHKPHTDAAVTDSLARMLAALFVRCPCSQPVCTCMCTCSHIHVCACMHKAPSLTGPPSQKGWRPLLYDILFHFSNHPVFYFHPSPVSIW